MKRLIALIVTTAFILIQCGFSFAGQPSNLRAKAAGDDGDKGKTVLAMAGAMGNPGVAASAAATVGNAIPVEKPVGEETGSWASGQPAAAEKTTVVPTVDEIRRQIAPLEAPQAAAAAMGRRDFIKKSLLVTAVAGLGVVGAELYEGAKRGPSLGEMLLPENVKKFTVTFSQLGQIENIQIPECLEPCRKQLRLSVFVKSPGYEWQRLAEDVSLDRVVGAKGIFDIQNDLSGNGMHEFDVDVHLRLVFAGTEEQGGTNTTLLDFDVSVPGEEIQLGGGLKYPVTITGEGKIKPARAAGDNTTAAASHEPLVSLGFTASGEAAANAAGISQQSTAHSPQTSAMAESVMDVTTMTLSQIRKEITDTRVQLEQVQHQLNFLVREEKPAPESESYLLERQRAQLIARENVLQAELSRRSQGALPIFAEGQQEIRELAEIPVSEFRRPNSARQLTAEELREKANHMLGLVIANSEDEAYDAAEILLSLDTGLLRENITMAWTQEQINAVSKQNFNYTVNVATPGMFSGLPVVSLTITSVSDKDALKRTINTWL